MAEYQGCLGIDEDEVCVMEQDFVKDMIQAKRFFDKHKLGEPTLLSILTLLTLYWMENPRNDYDGD